MEVEGEPVHRHPTGDADTDGSDLALPRPHPRVARLGPRLDTKLGQGLDQRLFQPADVGDDLLGVVETQDRVADELTGAVEGDVATAIHVVHLGPETDPVDEEVGAVAVASDGEHRRVLQQEQIVVPGPTDDLPLMDCPLQIPRLGVGQPTQPSGA